MLPGDRLCVVTWREHGVDLLLWPCVLCCQVTDFAWSHDGNMVFICYCNHVFYVARWQTLRGHMMETWRWSATVTVCSMLPGDKLCVVTWREHGVDLLLWPCVLCFQVTDFAWSHDGNMALICYCDGFVLVGSVAGHRYWSSMLNLDDTSITCGVWSPDDQKVLRICLTVFCAW